MAVFCWPQFPIASSSRIQARTGNEGETKQTIRGWLILYLTVHF